jgi:superfamily I DNA and/or RNA helicase
MILTGPAGTGKTKALLVSILKTLEYGKSTDDPKRILVCTPSHTAADVVSRRLGKVLTSKQLFRLYDVSRPVEMVPADMFPFTKQGITGEFLLPDELLDYEVIVCTCSDAHNLFLAGVTNSSLRERRRCVQVACETYLKASGLEHTIKSAYNPHFTHLFIDEAAQATEPETLIPFSVVVDDCPLAPKVEIALIGDPRQLSPNIYSPHAHRLQKSLLERLLRLPADSLGGGRGHLMGPPTKDTWTSLEELIEYSLAKKEDHSSQHNLSTFLTLSYRGHPSFLLMPSKLFYFDKLKSVHTMENPDDEWNLLLRRSLESQSNRVMGTTHPKQESWPIHFRGVIGTDASVSVESFWGSNSWQNSKEAQTIVEMIEMLVKQEKVSTQSIGVMAAFRAQVVLIRRLLREQGLSAVNVGMVEDYQAAEKDVIIVSLTRSSLTFLQSDVERRAGLFQQPKRINVALTRAEKALIVVGNPITMEKDPIWNQWLRFCLQNGLWYGEEGEDLTTKEDS